MNNRNTVLLFIGLIVIYFSLFLITPADAAVLAKYNLSQAQARILNLSIIIPLVCIWVTALYGYLRFNTYANLVADGPEGKPLKTVAKGLLFLALSQPLNAVISSFNAYLVLKHHGSLQTGALLRNYSSVIFTVAALLLLSKGTQQLLQNFKFRDRRTPFIAKYHVLLVILLTSAFNWLILSKPFTQQDAASIYYMPSAVIVLTIAVPYVYAWYQGLLASARLHIYVKKVRGMVYKQGFNAIAYGIATVVAASIFIQFVTTLSARLNRLNLTPLLMLVYFLLIFYAVGFGMIARGAKKLRKIEEA